MINPWNIIGWLVLILISFPLVALILFLMIRGLTRLILMICTSLHISCDRLEDFYETL